MGCHSMIRLLIADLELIKRDYHRGPDLIRRGFKGGWALLESSRRGNVKGAMGQGAASGLKPPLRTADPTADTGRGASSLQQEGHELCNKLRRSPGSTGHAVLQTLRFPLCKAWGRESSHARPDFRPTKTRARNSYCFKQRGL